MSIIDRIAGTSRLGHDVEGATRALRSGKMTIIVDRDDHGHLFLNAADASADAINFMATEARGLICLALTQDRADALGLPLQPCRSDRPRRPRFAVSIEAREGVTTGISAHDRATTIAVAADATSGPADLVSPGHVFPIIAANNAAAEDFGPCEAGIELARMAEVAPAGVMCAILNEAGEMAGPAYLAAFAGRHGFAAASVQMIAARRGRGRTMQALLKSLDARGWLTPIGATGAAATYGVAA
jgi:3,4-dihydroxy 2-butanone 4-phosphate synthase/GTP cyclohydrolase II